MEYKKHIIKLLEHIEDERQLKYIYVLLTELITKSNMRRVR